MTKNEAAFVYLLLSAMSRALAEAAASNALRAFWIITAACLAVTACVKFFIARRERR